MTFLHCIYECSNVIKVKTYSLTFRNENLLIRFNSIAITLNMIKKIGERNSFELSNSYEHNHQCL
jgi:hypothetical protein